MPLLLGLNIAQISEKNTEEIFWVFRTMTLACIHATFPLLLYESACNSSGSMSTKRQ
jgi:hypothetical protein